MNAVAKFQATYQEQLDLQNRQRHAKARGLLALPIDVILELLKATVVAPLKDETGINEYSVWKVSRDLMALSSVCSGLRQVVISNPTLWLGVTTQSNPLWTKLILERNPAGPLFVHLSLSHDRGIRPTSLTRETLREHLKYLLPAGTQRWRRLKIGDGCEYHTGSELQDTELDIGSVSQLWKDSKCTNFEAVSQLELYGIAASAILPPDSRFGGLTVLRAHHDWEIVSDCTIASRFLSDNSNLTDVSFNLAQYRSAHQGMGIYEILAVLSKLDRLKTLKAEMDFSAPGDTFPSRDLPLEDWNPGWAFTFRSLESFTFHGSMNAGSSNNHLFGLFIRMPALVNLHLDMEVNGVWGINHQRRPPGVELRHTGEMLGFLDAFAIQDIIYTTLKTFKLRYVRGQDDWCGYNRTGSNPMHTLLAKMPALQTLELAHQPWHIICDDCSWTLPGPLQPGSIASGWRVVKELVLGPAWGPRNVESIAEYLERYREWGFGAQIERLDVSSVCGLDRPFSPWFSDKPAINIFDRFKSLGIEIIDDSEGWDDAMMTRMITGMV